MIGRPYSKIGSSGFFFSCRWSNTVV